MRQSFLLLVLAALSLGAHAQTRDLRTVIEEDPSLAYTVYQPYAPREGKLTPAPCGYKPFYISHYGRHGSRYLTSDSYFEEGRHAFQQLAEAGLLTEEGKQAHADFTALMDMHRKMYGELSARGAREHQGVSQRMYRRFGRVFRKRRKVHCVSSTVPRCLMSMANFTSVLKGNEPRLDISYLTGQKYFEILCHGFDADGMFADVRRIDDSLGRADSRYEKLYKRLLTDPERAKALLGDPMSLAHGLYIGGIIAPCLDAPDPLRFFEADELASFAIPLNNRIYGEFCNSLEWGRYPCEAAKGLVLDFVQKADEALKSDSPVAADLRFGHDSGLIPLLSLLEIDRCDVRAHIAHADRLWHAHDMIPMCSNLQLVFYRNGKGHVLVKILYNEAETSIKALPGGPWYAWEDLRAWMLKKAE
ncbi:MAG: hypothetical protein IJ652_00940 [Bacteroidales bacterium]|nr:hypothetical protein [Bacteroidales bacterium]